MKTANTVTTTVADVEMFEIEEPVEWVKRRHREQLREEARQMQIVQQQNVLELKRDAAAMKREELQLMREANQLMKEQNQLIASLLAKLTGEKA